MEIAFLKLVVIKVVKHVIILIILLKIHTNIVQVVI